MRHRLGGIAVQRLADLFRKLGRQIRPIHGKGKAEIFYSAPDPQGPDQLWEEEWERHVLAICQEQVRREFGTQY
jgi:hypothetical protein